MRQKYYLPFFLLFFSIQFVFGKESTINLISENKYQSQMESKSNQAAGTASTSQLASPATFSSVTYNPFVDPTTRTLNTSYLAGTTKGGFDVNAAGGANYTIPIDVLPGINGLAPSLSLVYSSNSGPGIVGYGWSIGGLSAIGRTGQNYYNDGVAMGVNLTAFDKFTLDGQRLVPTSGNYGANLTTYQTEIDIFTRAQSLGALGSGPAEFMTQTKSGLTNQYGYTADSKQLLPSIPEVVTWFINQTSDLYGNIISYSYINDNNMVYPSQINYGLNSITFSYKTRADTVSSYLRGQKIQQTLLLDKVTVSYNSNIVKSYQMNYNLISDNYNNYSVLNEVVESGIGTDRYNSTVFSYQTPASAAFPQTPTSVTNADVTYKSRICTGDFNGDGKAEILCLPDASKGATWTGMRVYSGDGTNFTTYFSSTTSLDLTKLDDIQALDINGDGIDDIVYEVNNSGTSTYYYMLNTGNSFGAPVVITTMTNGTNTGMNGKSRRKNFKQENDNQFSGTDYNGDGVNDIFINDPNGNWKLYSMANSSGTLTASLDLLGSGSISTLNGQTLSADYNGDGIAEIWSVESTGTKIYSFSGSTLILLNSLTVPSSSNFFTLGDFNGDKKADIFIYGDATSDWANWQFYLSSGTGFDIKNIPQKKANLKNDYVRSGDFNGDGCTDLMVTSSNQSWAGTFFYISKNKGTNLYTETLTSYPNELDNFYLADFNGDGRTDFINTDGASPYWDGYKIDQTTGNTSPLLQNVANGNNLLTTPSYTKLSQAGQTVYAKNPLTFPMYSYQGPMPVVSSVNMLNGIGTVNNYGYFYSGASVHRQGKGFLSFSGIIKTDYQAQTQTETDRTYAPTYYYPQAIRVFIQSNTGIVNSPISPLNTMNPMIAINTIYTTTNTWSQLVLDATNKRIYPYIQSSTGSNSLTNFTTTVAASLVDNYGNAGQIVQSNSSGYSKTTVSNYTNTVSSTNWKLGLLNSSTATDALTGVSPVSQTVKFTYSTDGILKPDSINYNPGTGLAFSNINAYDSKGNLTQVITSGVTIGSSQVNYTYTTDGTRLLTATDPLGHVTTNAYDSNGRLYTQKDYLNNTITFGYDNLSRQSSESSTIGSQSSTTYLWTGTNKPSLAVYGISQTGNDGSVSIAWYDQLARVIRTEKKGFGGSMILTDTQYNNLGQVYRISVPYFAGGTVVWSETYTYDINNRLISTVRYTGRNSTYSYNGGTVTETTAGNISSKTYLANGSIGSATDNGGTITYAYYADGKPSSITAPGGVVTTMQYADAERNQTQMVDPSAGTINYIYDALGRVTRQTDARSQLTHTFYLNDGRINIVSTPEGTTTYTYNTNKQLTGISSPNNVSRSYGYDTQGRVNSITDSIAGSRFLTSFTYDNLGRLSTRTHPSGIVETMGYNSNGYLATISAGGSTQYTVTGMNALQQLTGSTYGSTTPFTATFGFDAYGFPLSQNVKTGAVFTQDYRYVFEPITGTLTSRQNYLQNKSESFAYDNTLDRLLTVTGPQNLTMTYNTNGTINTRSDIGTTAFSYGNGAGPYALTGVTSSTTVIPAINQTATYNSFEKVSTLTEGIYSAAFIYNANNQRAKMDVAQSGTNILTRWYAGNSYVKETAAGVTKEYTYLGGDAYTAPVAAITQSGTTTYYYLLRDYLGNITHTVNATTNAVNEYSFDVWGRRRNPADWSYTLTSQPAMFADRGFTSHEFLSWFNLYNMNGRLYDPLVGRFLSVDNYVQDPTNTQHYNRYSYCLNNPLKYNDPSGNDTESENSNDQEKTWDDYTNEGLPPTTWGGGGSYGTEGNNGFYGYMSATAQGYTGGMNEFVDNYHKQGNNGTFSYKSGNYYFVPIELPGEEGAYVAERKVYETVTLDITADPNLAIDYITEINLPGIINKAVTSTIVGKGPVHIRSVNGSKPSIIYYFESGALTYESSSTQGASQSLSISIGNYYISANYNEDTFNFGFGGDFGNSTAGFEMRNSNQALQLLLIPVVIEAPILIPILIGGK